MRYAMLIHEPAGVYDHLERAGRDALTAEFVALLAEDRVLGGARLAPADTATTVRVIDGELLLTDGPFAETKEVFGGYLLVEEPDLDAALRTAARIPSLRFGGSVEVRPVRER